MVNNGVNGYWVSFEYKTGSIGTWSDYANNPDEFIASLLEQEKGKHIKKFLEFHCDGTIADPYDYPKVDKIAVRKYNSQLKRAEQSVHPTRAGGGA